MKAFKITTYFNDATQKDSLTVISEVHQKTPSNHLARQTSITGGPRHGLPATVHQCSPRDLTAADVLIHYYCFAHLGMLSSPPGFVQKNTENTETQFSLLT